MSCIYPPSPGLGQASKNTAHFPRLALRVRRLSPQVSRPLRTRSRAVGAMRAQRATSRPESPLASTHTHTLSLSLSPSLSGSRHNDRRTPSLVQPCARTHFGDVAWLSYSIPFPFRTHARTLPPPFRILTTAFAVVRLDGVFRFLYSSS